MQVRAAHPAKIRIIRGGKKKTHSSAFDKFETFVLKKTPRCLRALLFRFPLGLPQPILTPNSLLTRCKQRAVHYLAMRTNSLLTPCKQGAVLSRYSPYHSFYITTCFFNTNNTNFSNVAERLTEGTIRFVLHTNLSESHECR